MELDEQDDNDTPSNRGDERLVHALLMHILDDHAADHREARVQRSIVAIAAQEQLLAPKLLPRRRRALAESRWLGRLGMAAAVLIAVGLWVWNNNSTIASTTIDKIVAALSAQGDRTFAIEMRDLPQPSGKRGPRGTDSVPRPGLNGATLYLRDADQYVLVRRDPRGGQMFDGFDGRHSWRVRRGRVDEVREGLGAGGIPMPPIMADVPFTDLPGTLQAIESDYRIEEQNAADVPPDGPEALHLVIRRKSRRVKGPSTIEIWADPVTAMPRRIVFDDAKVQGNQAPCPITLTLTSEEALPADWFEPEAHADAE